MSEKEAELLKEKLKKFVSSKKMLTMATASKSGLPNATPHEYLYDSESGEFFLEITEKHPSVKNIEENPVVHFVIQSTPNFENGVPANPSESLVVQILANAEIIRPSDPNMKTYWNKLLKEFPFMKMFPIETRVILVFKPKNAMILEFSKNGMKRNTINFE